MELIYYIGTYYDEPEEMHVVKAMEDGEMIGELYADLTTGQIMQIEVVTERLREGIATAMFEFAGTKFEIFHSPDMHCTREGLAFKQAVGGEEIDPELAYQP